MPLGFSFLPQENRFYEVLHESGEYAYQSVQLLTRLVREPDRAKAEKLGQDIENAKRSNKASTQEVTAMLCKTFVTPFDREDINSLARGLYSIPKLAEKTQERILSFYLQPFENDFIELTDNMAQASEHLRALLKNLEVLKVSPEMNERCASIQNIEGKTDDLLNQRLLTLFQKEHDIKQLILRKDIYDLMEKLVDRHRDLSNIILEIMLKHS